MSFISQLTHVLLRLAFYTPSPLEVTPEQAAEFERIYEQGLRDGVITYDGHQPKPLFIRYIVENKRVVVHGSNHNDIQRLEPRNQTLYDGRIVNAVFAAKDGIWPLFFAVLDRQRLNGSIRNACLTINRHRNRKYYFFSVPPHVEPPWRKGTIKFSAFLPNRQRRLHEVN